MQTKRLWVRITLGVALAAFVAAPVLMMIDSGPRIHVSYRQTYTFVQRDPVIQAIIDRKSLDEIKQIVAKNAVILKDLRENGSTPPHWAVGEKRLDLAKYFLDAGVDINARDLTDDGTGGDGATALEEAVGKRDKDMVQLLLQRGADPTITDKEGRTPAALADEINWSEYAELTRSTSRPSDK